MFEQLCLNENTVRFRPSHYKMPIVPFCTVASYFADKKTLEEKGITINNNNVVIAILLTKFWPKIKKLRHQIDKAEITQTWFVLYRNISDLSAIRWRK